MTGDYLAGRVVSAPCSSLLTPSRAPHDPELALGDVNARTFVDCIRASTLLRGRGFEAGIDNGGEDVVFHESLRPERYAKCSVRRVPAPAKLTTRRFIFAREERR